MPERPDLDWQVPILVREISGRTIAGVRVKKPVVVRAVVPMETLVGSRFVAIRRHLHFVHFGLDGVNDVVVHPMLAGRFWIGTGKEPAETAVTFVLDDSRELRYRDSMQMGKVYVVTRGEERSIPGFWPAGVDVLDPAFTDEAFARIVKGRREQAKVFLMDKTTLDAFGNCYADEVLFDAGIHPKTPMNKLGPADLARLRASIVGVLQNANAEIAARRPPLEEKEREFTKIRNRGGEPCPRCGGTIRASGVHGHDAFYCPTCQPDVAGKGFAGWRKPT